MDPQYICSTCARWIIYPCVIGRVKQDAWRCANGVKDAPERKECPYYLREIGSEAW